MARQSASLSATAMALAVFAAAAMAITAAPAAAMAITDAASIRPDQKVDFSELGADEQYATLGFDLADLQPEPPSGGRQRRAVNFATPDIILHSPVLLDTALAGVPGSGFNITFSTRGALSYDALDFYLLAAGTFSGSVFARNVLITNSSWGYVPPA